MINIITALFHQSWRKYSHKLLDLIIENNCNVDKVSLTIKKLPFENKENQKKKDESKEDGTEKEDGSEDDKEKR